MDARNMALRDDFPFSQRPGHIESFYVGMIQNCPPQRYAPQKLVWFTCVERETPIGRSGEGINGSGVRKRNCESTALEMLGMLQGKTIRLGGLLTNYLITLLLFNIAMDDDP